MPIYFNDVAPFCPVSRDQVPPGMPAMLIRTTIPPARDLQTALAAVNIARSIVIQITSDTVINNLHTAPIPKPPKQRPPRTVDMRKHAHWQEQKSERIKRKYKYYGEQPNGDKDKDVWVMTERIERMVWYDSAWRAYLIWEYGDKGEGEPVK